MSAQKRSFSKYLSVGLSSVFIAAVVALVACTNNEAKAKPNLVFKAPPAPGVVAKINGQNITEDQLIGDDRLDFFDLQKREYDLKMDRLNKLMVNIILGDKAKKAGMSLDDYISKKVIGSGGVKISNSEYKKFVADKHIPEAQINPQIKQRIMAYLQEMKKQDLVDNAVAKATKDNPVEVYFSKPKLQVNVEAGNSPMWGNPNAKVTIIEFSDFQCPFCARANSTVTELKKKYDGKIKIYYRNFPLPMHQFARGAAEAAMCVWDNGKGNQQFWKLADVLFKNQDKLEPADLRKYASQVGADMKAYDACIASKGSAAKVQEDQAYGEKVGVRSTPTFFINGQLVSGAQPLDVFSDTIDDELSSSK